MDITPFVQILVSGDYQTEADTNEDGVVNLLDVDMFIEVMTNG